MTDEQAELIVELEEINKRLEILRPIKATNYQEIDELVVERYFTQKRYYQLRKVA